MFLFNNMQRRMAVASASFLVCMILACWPVWAQNLGKTSLENAVAGTWLVKLKDSKRERQVVVADIGEDGPDHPVVAFYGWSDNVPKRVNGTIAAVNGSARLILFLPDEERLILDTLSGTRMGGELVRKDGQKTTATVHKVGEQRQPKAISNHPVAVIKPGDNEAGLVDQILNGNWEMTVGQSDDVRHLNFRNLRKENDHYIVDAISSDQSLELSPQKLSVRVRNGIVSLKFRSPQGDDFYLKSAATDRFIGTTTNSDSRVRKVRLVKVAIEAPRAKTKKKVKEILLVYIGAGNCPSCSFWDNSYRSKLLQSDDGKRIKFRSVGTYHYMRTDRDQDWPDDLKWIRSRTNVAFGTPRFVVITDGEVEMNTTGIKNYETKVLPKIHRLVQQLD